MTKYKNMRCNYCDKVCKNDNSLRNHERLCKLNPNKQVLVSNFIKWNNDVRNGLKQGSNQYIKAKENGNLEVSYRCGGKCGLGYKVFLKKIHGKWRVIKKVETWIS